MFPFPPEGQSAAARSSSNSFYVHGARRPAVQSGEPRARGRHRLCPPNGPIPEMTGVVRRHGLSARMATSCSSRRPRSSLPLRSIHVARANNTGPNGIDCQATTSVDSPPARRTSSERSTPANSECTRSTFPPEVTRSGALAPRGWSSRRSPHALGTSRETHRRSPAVVPRACHRATVLRGPSNARRRRYRRTVARTESSGTALSGGVSRGERRQVA